MAIIHCSFVQHQVRSINQTAAPNMCIEQITDIITNETTIKFKSQERGLNVSVI